MTRVNVSSVINAPAVKVWNQIRNFNGLPEWHPAVVESFIEGDNPADQISCIRNFRLVDGGLIRERLLALSDYDFSCIYSILESPLGVHNYVANLKLIPITDGERTFAEWSAEFECSSDQEMDLIKKIGKDVFQAGFNGLKKRFQ